MDELERLIRENEARDPNFYADPNTKAVLTFGTVAMAADITKGRFAYTSNSGHRHVSRSSNSVFR